MKVLVTGSKGMLGSDVLKVFSEHHEVVGAGRKDFDITDLYNSLQFLEREKPDVVIHTASYNEVDNCEENIDLAFKVNALGTRNIAIACSKIDAAMIYISTDYVYDGEKEKPYLEYDIANPLNVYGRSKLEGEIFVKLFCKKHYIVRTSWLFGKNGKNFVKAMLALAKDRKEILVVNDQVGSPTYTKDLAKALLELVLKPAYGMYHITNSDFCSWYDFAKYIFRVANLTGVEVKPITAEELGRRAHRPKNSILQKFYLSLNDYSLLRSYKEAVKEYIESVED